MNITKHEFGLMLKAKLETTHDIPSLSRWAYQFYFDNSRRVEPVLKDILLDLGRMEDAPEFEYSSEELSVLAVKMIGESS